MKIFLGGINGVGKTTVLRSLGVVLPSLKIVHGSRDYMHFLGIPTNGYEQLRAVPEEKHRVMLRELIHSKVNDVSNDETLIFDGHFVVFDQAESPIIKVSDWLQHFDLMILLEADANDIYQRVEHDQVSNIRHRSYPLSEPKEVVLSEIQRRLNYTHNVAYRTSEWFKVPLLTIKNTDISLTIYRILTYIRENSHATNI